MAKRVFLTALLLCAMGMWFAPSWAACTGTATSTTAAPGPGPIILTGHTGIGTASWTVNGSTDQTSNFNTLLSNCSGYTYQLDCTNNSGYAINGAVAGGRFNLTGCGRGNTPLVFGASGNWEMQPASGFGGYSTVQDLFISGNSAATAFTEDSGSNNNVFLNFYCNGVAHCIVDHGSYNVIDHMWAYNFNDSAIDADGVGPIWHDIALQSGSSSHPCIYYSGSSLIMNTFDINICGGDMVIEGVTGGNACQAGPGNWNHISDGFFDAVSNYPGSTPSVEIKNTSSGNCQMGSTHFSNVGFESSLIGLKIDTDTNYLSTINSVTCTECQFHNNKNQGLYVTGDGVHQIRLSNVTVVSNGASPSAPTTALTPNAEFACNGCSVFIDNSSFGGDGSIIGGLWGQSNEGPNETAKSTVNFELGNIPVSNTTKIFVSNTYFDGERTSGSNINDPRAVLCFNPDYSGTSHAIACSNNGGSGNP